MKLIQTISTLSTVTILGLTSIASADCKEGCDKTTCKTATCDKDASCTDCSDCDKDANTISLAVTGMTCEGCSSKLTKALASTEGVTAEKVCHKTGCVTCTIDPAKTDKTKLIAAVNATGFKVTGEKLSVPVSGMTCSACSKKVTTALEAIDGCTVGTVCHKSGKADITIDTAKTSEEKVIEAINATGFKAGEAKKEAAPEKKES